MAIRPPALVPGDAVAVVAPASPAGEEAALRGMAALAAMGLRPRPGAHLGLRRGYLAGTDRERAADLLAAWADPEVKAVFCLRGGYGSLRLLPLLNYGLPARRPKLLVGYSDVTALLLAVHRCAGLVTVHGPMVASDLGRDCDPLTRSWLARMLFTPAPLGPLPPPPGGEAVTIRPGRAAGELVGGNLSLVTATLGTPYELDTAGRILFLEEVGEEPYRLDRLLTQLRLAGKLAAAAGVAIGRLGDWPAGPEGAGGPVRGVLEDVLGDLGVPVVAGMPWGHAGINLALPLGVRAELDAAAGTLTLLEPVTAPP